MKYAMELTVLALILLFAGSFVIVLNTGEHEWGGTDGQAGDIINEMTGTEYEPWADPIYEPASGEIESLFFCLQAAIGALVIGFFFGYYYRGRRINT
ncbi:energy-coupling factor ABC transporter substrate-binding protein [Methanofollis formosanus]|uniref:Cobalt transport protein CbiN n=1 Tax=Methanofollis formosanus TaxID=299308 RepID=A0A8G1A0I1_9EURY|nr:energy-coupling factor ABC transporter substrate-binding protein [Methanofollis formosanus]QYZ78800.1 energy-coupling factor ABC transporter substrate-binding protein [Methanofollis formosanus]